jgi:hypothetical protein
VADARTAQSQVKEIMDVATSVTEDEARVALEQCDGSEEQAVTALVSDPSFLRRVQSLARNTRGGEGGAAPIVVVAAASASSRPLGGAIVSRSRKPITKQSAPGAVFVGSFRGKLYKSAERAPAAKSKGAAATTPAASGSAAAAAKADTDEEEEEQPADEQPVAAKKAERQQPAVAAAASSKAWMLCERVARDATVAVEDIDIARLKGRRFQVEWQDGNVYRGHIASVNKVRVLCAPSRRQRRCCRPDPEPYGAGPAICGAQLDIPRRRMG